ncbi:MAG: PAC2 family protein [Solirubrobacterales bacterium]|nr:PAC2 family protein [Solirubrobacterales bacterium]
MQPVNWSRRPDGLRAPVMVCAFGGWNDAGDSASDALAAVSDAFSATSFATIDLEPFVDLRETRPIVRLVDGETREIVWPESDILSAYAPRAPRDLVLLQSPEPALHWRAYCATVIELAEALNCSMVVTLGGFLADVPHTRPVPVAGSATDEELSEKLGLVPSNYQGPTGITGVLHAACAAADMPSVSLWAAVPHYIATMANPKASLALVRKLESLTGVIVDAAPLERAAAEQEHQVELAIEHDSDMRTFVEQLEEAVGEQEPEQEEIPSGDAIARDVQRFLRQQGTDGS